MEGASQTGLTPSRLSHSHLEPGGNWDAEMRDINEGGGQARAWSHMRTSPARRGGFVLKGQRYPSLRVGAGALGPGNWHVTALDLAPETSPELATQLPQGSLLYLSWSQASCLSPL